MGKPHRADQLTDRESEVLSLIRLGLTNEQIAERLGVTLAGAKYHVSEILSKLGVSSREEASALQPASRDTWWRRALTVSLVLKIAGALVVTAALAGTALLALGAIRGGSGEAGVLDSDDLRNDSALTISGNSIGVVSLTSGQSLRTVAPGGDSPWAVLRPSAKQLLVSDVTQDGGRLRIYAIERDPTLVREVPMTARLLSTSGYDPAMALSADERTLYYESVIQPNCPRGSDAAVCDIYAIQLINLETGNTTEASGLPANCGYARLAPLGGTDALVTCPYTSDTYEAHSSGLVEKIAKFLGGYPVIFGGYTHDRPFLLSGDGRVLFDDDTSVRLLQAGQRVESWSSWQLPSGDLLVAYSGGEEAYDDIGFPMVQGVLIVDPLETESAKDYTLPADTSYVYPLPGKRLALLNRNAGTIEIDALTADGLVKERQFASDATWIAY